IYQGKVTDADYLGQNRTDMFSYSKSHADKGFLFDIGGAVGYVIPLMPSWNIIPISGYSYHKQKLSLIGGELIVDIFRPVSDKTGALSDLNSRYTAKWYGPYAGTLFTGYLFGVYFTFGYWYQTLIYRAEGYWNLHKEFIGNFKHSGSGGSGHTMEVTLNYPVSACFSIGCALKKQDLKVTSGKDSTIFEEEGEIYNSAGKLNHARSKSYSLIMTLSYIFDMDFTQKRGRIRDKLRRSYG
ncbi:hypothetical protein N9Y92_00235, partial [Chlamydiales bacterium]|nr:hypothetical protein [Chlamydiales bacterium]